MSPKTFSSNKIVLIIAATLLFLFLFNIWKKREGNKNKRNTRPSNSVTRPTPTPTVSPPAIQANGCYGGQVRYNGECVDW